MVRFSNPKEGGPTLRILGRVSVGWVSVSLRLTYMGVVLGCPRGPELSGFSLCALLRSLSWDDVSSLRFLITGLALLVRVGSCVLSCAGACDML